MIKEVNTISFKDALKTAVPCKWRTRTHVDDGNDLFGKWRLGLFLGYTVDASGIDLKGAIVYDEKTKRHIFVYTPTQLKMIDEGEK